MATRENEDPAIFREFMTATMIINLKHDIRVYLESTETESDSGEKIIALLSENKTWSAAILAEHIGITAKAVEKHIARLKADSILNRIGPDKGGY